MAHRLALFSNKVHTLGWVWNEVDINFCSVATKRVLSCLLFTAVRLYCMCICYMFSLSFVLANAACSSVWQRPTAGRRCSGINIGHRNSPAYVIVLSSDRKADERPAAESTRSRGVWSMGCVAVRTGRHQQPLYSDPTEYCSRIIALRTRKAAIRCSYCYFCFSFFHRITSG